MGKRQLRPRNSRPSYVEHIGLEEDEDDTNPNPTPEQSTPGPNNEGTGDGDMDLNDNESSGSDFMPEKKGKGKSKGKGKGQSSENVKGISESGSDEDDDEDDEGDEDDEEEEEPTPQKARKKPQAKIRANGVIQGFPPPEERHVTIIANGNTIDEPYSTIQPSKGPRKKQTQPPNATPGPSGVRPHQKTYSLPSPSIHHRHRAIPIYTQPGSKTTRLTAPPKLFKEPELRETNAFTSNERVSDRVTKAWGYNVGPGPLWELVEDRSWFKESGETMKRKRVHGHIPLKAGWNIMSKEQTTPYLPADITTDENGQLNPAPPVTCSFGPFGSQTKVEVPGFSSFPMARYIPESKSHIFNPGAPAWGMDWCPIHEDDRKVRPSQYLAVSAFPSKHHSPDIGKRNAGVSSPGNIQIWSLSPSKAKPPATESLQAQRKGKAKSIGGKDGDGDTIVDDPSTDIEDIGEMTCEMVLCVDSGPAYSLKWIPLPTHTAFRDTEAKETGSLGLLSGTFEDGSFAIYVVPDPVALRRKNKVPDDGDPVYVHLPAPIIKIDMDSVSCWSLDWANSEVVAIGTSGGVIAVYDLGEALRLVKSPDAPTLTPTTHPEVLFPTHCLTVHQCAIRAVAWIRTPSQSSILSDIEKGEKGKEREVVEDDDEAWDNPTVIASGGYDGLECLTDIREGRGVVMNRTRDVITSMCYAPYAGGVISIDHENMVKAFSASPRMLGRGHLLMEPQGPIWSIAASDYHAQIAIGSADGTCTTTNTLRSTRRDGPVPFLIHRIYQLDYSRNLKEFRMLERFHSVETQDRPTVSKSKSRPKPRQNAPPQPKWNTGAWTQEVGIHTVTWNSSNGPENSGLLASATSSGLCRIDWLGGRWMHSRLPYSNIESIRMEGIVPDNASESESD